MNNLQTLRQRQTDATLTRWREAALAARPPAGWIRSIRQALGMSSAALAQRLSITDSGLRKLEEAESQDAITLGTLRKVAAALDCELQYALVPRQRLAHTLQQRAAQVAQEQMQRVSHSMALEAQGVDPYLTALQVQQLASELLAKGGKGLW